MSDPFNSRDFYELCQVYRHADPLKPAGVVEAFEALKDYGRKAVADRVERFPVIDHDAAVERCAWVIGELDGGSPDRDRALQDAINAVRALKAGVPRAYPGFDNLPTPRTDAVDIPANWDTPDKLAALCRQLEREVTLADDSYADLCQRHATERAGEQSEVPRPSDTERWAMALRLGWIEPGDVAELDELIAHPELFVETESDDVEVSPGRFPPRGPDTCICADPENCTTPVPGCRAGVSNVSRRENDRG
jgi:hypothetical protein